MIETNMFLYIIDIIALLFLAGLLHGDNLLSNNRKRAFLYGIGFTLLVVCAEVGTLLANGGSEELRIFNILCNVLGFAIAPIIPIVLIAIFDIKILQMNNLVLLPTILNIVATLLSPWFGLIFYVDLNNNYERGSVFIFFVAVYVINIILFLSVTWHIGQKYLYPIKWKIVGLSVFTLIGTCIQLFFPLVHLSWHSVTLTLFLLYILLLEFEGSFDTITEIYNRKAFEKASKQLNDKKMFSLIVMDINNFKEINDTYGHDYGDTVLKEVAEVIRESFDENCSWYRIGGDEFCVIRRDANQEKLEQQLRCMIKDLAKTRKNDSCLPMVSYGYSAFKGDKPMDFQKIFKEADDQMYCYKNDDNSGK
ncbi:MAG: GGDEF domain-containing protein [Peptostreptococcaceae bacterium]|nr:GGDEF domain-containing protein [Peptostreptococcaceae bacterium]